ncbi:MAG TPA: hypothetical protein VJN63_08265 [Thermoplasmata archaeon]|nr:hypothetical protein [Thermoplasmata archaeon]
MAGISIHLGTVATGLGFVGTLLSPAFDATAGTSFWDRVQAIGTKLANNAEHQRNLLLLGGAYMGIKAIRSSVEKAPLISLGKLRIYAL